MTKSKEAFTQTCISIHIIGNLQIMDMILVFFKLGLVHWCNYIPVNNVWRLAYL